MPLSEYRRKRDFKRTAEPHGGSRSRRRSRDPRFVIQKHAASHLHFDLRLEVGGVMKSWAVPKGPSSQTTDRRLAVQVEDHPIEYNEFEGIIPQGEYGGGTVMLWDVGTYTVEDAGDEDPEDLMEERHRTGEVKVNFSGERIKGSYALVRMRPRKAEAKPAWLLIKHRDRYAGKGDIAAKFDTSVVTGRTMQEIADDDESATWKSKRRKTATRARKKTRTARVTKRSSTRSSRRAAATLQPMLATIGKEIPEGDWTFEPKYDGIRVLAFCTKDAVHLITRNGLDKSLQFPEIVEALRKLARSARRSIVLDGEIVALERGKPARFQQLQGRMHVTKEGAIAGHRRNSPAAIAVFDILLDGDEVLIHEPWTERRDRLETRLHKRVSETVMLTPSSPRAGKKLLDRARKNGWEGVIAKRMDARYEPGKRSRNWLKLKTDNQQEFVVGGWTEPRQSRQHIGAILLGYYDEAGDLIYAGHTGGGFSGASLAEMHRLLKPLERQTAPFKTTPRTNEKPHWVRPKVVVEVRFNEWTADGKLRQPIFLGVRNDKSAKDVIREPESVQPRKRARSKAE